jgi:hypothetical protein
LRAVLLPPKMVLETEEQEAWGMFTRRTGGAT